MPLFQEIGSAISVLVVELFITITMYGNCYDERIENILVHKIERIKDSEVTARVPVFIGKDDRHHTIQSLGIYKNYLQKS